MFELNVYYHDVLRYSIIANWGKVEELQNQGFYVRAKAAPQSKLNWAERDHPDRFRLIDDAIKHRDEEFWCA